MRVRPSVREREKGVRHLVDLDDPAGVALCGRPGPWSEPTSQEVLKKCPDCATSYQMKTNHVGGRAWVGR